MDYHFRMRRFRYAVTFAAVILLASLRVMAQGDTTELSIENKNDFQTLSPPYLSGRMFFPQFLIIPPTAKEDFSKYRQLTPGEILDRDRKLILTRMILEDPTPVFIRELRGDRSFWSKIALMLLGLANVGGMSTFDQLVPPVQVSGQPYFDDMIFLDPNFDPRIYQPSMPVPQYDPLNPFKPYKASVTSPPAGQ